MRNGSRHSGFTLLEVLIAMAILALLMPVIFKVISQVSLSAIQLQNKTYAQWVALNKMAEMRLQTAWPALGKSDGESEMAGQTWHWVMEVKNTDDKDVHKLIISVNPESDKNDPVALSEVTAFLGRPL